MEQSFFQKQADGQCCENSNKPESHLLFHTHRTHHQAEAHKTYRARIDEHEPTPEELRRNPLMRWSYIHPAFRRVRNQAVAV